MRYIEKKVEPDSFRKWKAGSNNANWSDFSGSEGYNDLRKLLIAQQGQMCCYCELKIASDNEAHIEHVKDKKSYPQLTFDFNNLLASCQVKDNCGHKKGANYFNGMVTPLQHDCSDRFTYTQLGGIIPASKDDSMAEETIKVLNLNSPKLKSRRKTIICALEDCDHDFISQAIDNCLEWYHGFETLIQYMLDKCKVRD